MTAPTELSSDLLRDVPESWPVTDREDVWRGGTPFAVRRDLVTMPDQDHPAARVVLEHPGAVVILAVDDEERALVLRQYRHPAGLRFVELPAGLLDVPDEDPLEAARRELLEEGGVEAGRWVHLNTVFPSPGISAERIETYLATDLRSVPDRGGFALEHEEADMTLHWVPVADLVVGVVERRLTDGPLATAVLTYALTRQAR